MFHQVSWGEFFTSTSATLICYYILVAAVYYRQEISSLLSGRSLEKNKKTKDNIEEFRQVVREVNGILEKAGKEASKSELLKQLKERLASFTGLRQPTSAVGKPAYKDALTNYIIKQAQIFCGVAFSEQELEEVWKTLLR